MKTKDLLSVDGAMHDEKGNIIQPSVTSALFDWKPNTGGRQAAIIVSKLATNRARIARLIGPGSEYDSARKHIIESHQVKRDDGIEDWEGETPEDKTKTFRIVRQAIDALIDSEVDATFERVDLGMLFELGCSLSPQQVDQLGFMLDTSTLEPVAPTT